LQIILGKTIQGSYAMPNKIRVSILDDHISIIDGYLYRINLGDKSKMEVVATMAYGEDLEPTLAQHPTDVLLLDISVPTSPDNPNPFPILYAIPKLLETYSNLHIVVITIHNDSGLIRAVMESGSSGYVLKDDQIMIRDLANVIQSVNKGDIVLSKAAQQLLLKHNPVPPDGQLTDRQLEALSLSAAYPDWTTADLSQKMSVANSTIRNLLSGAYLRLGVHTRMGAISKARQLGIIASDYSNLTPSS
jgi:DNA-binding NarL/FixJ family response regulator